MINLFKSHYHILATVVFLFCIVLAHGFATNNYDWTKHTISDLGAQGYERKAIMQFGFLIFGMILAFGILINGVSWRTIPILIYALCVALTGIYCTKPFFTTTTYSNVQAMLHSLFAQIAGVTFSLGLLFQAYHAPNNNLKIIHFVFFFLVILLSASFGYFKNCQGIMQRLLYFISFMWVLFYYKP